MRNSVAPHRSIAHIYMVFVAGACIALVGEVHAQGIPEVTPDGTLADPAAPPPAPEPAPAPGPVIIPIGPDGKPVPGALEAEDDGSFFYNDDDGAPRGQYPIGRAGPVPETHVVRRGDTLWDICWFYFNNPWEWPRVWSYNAQITNPHWIYPGDQVRLYPAGVRPTAGTQDDLDGIDAPTTSSRPRGWFSLRQLGFVDRERLEYSANIAGSTDERLLLSYGDTVYLTYPGENPPKVGKRYAIYKETKEIKHPRSGKKVGAYVKIVGELEVRSVKKGKRARAIITDSADVIERGMLVGPLQRQFKDVQPTASQVDLQGTVVAQLFADELIGARQVVFLDVGTADGLRKGNRMFVVRRGDAYLEENSVQVSTKGQDDRRYPARAIGEILVVQAGKNSSVGLVTLSMQEIEIGDLVLMRASSSSGE